MSTHIAPASQFEQPSTPTQRSRDALLLVDLPARWNALSATRSARFATAIVFTVLSLLGRWLLVPFLADHVPFALVYASVVLSAMFLGLWPSIASALIGIAGVRVFFAMHILRISSLRELSETATYVGGCFLIIAATEITRRAKSRLTLANRELAMQTDELRSLNRHLEQRVEQRTVELRKAEEAARHLGGEILRTQDQERRRIARELHDSVGQAVAVIKMNLGTLGSSENLSEIEAGLVSESRAIAGVAADEVRTISHLLHPPLLDDMGLPAALGWYIKGFSTRSGINTQLELSERFGRMPSDCEIAIFRIVQEALTNIHRHSGSSLAIVRVVWTPAQVMLEIADEGKGIPQDQLRNFTTGGAIGVGLRGMRERVEQLGGQLQLRSSSAGTTVNATFPLAATETVMFIATST